jgi:hypothetical protein
MLLTGALQTEIFRMALTNHFLDNYVVHKLSGLTECGAPELLLENRWLNAFILNSALRVRLPAENRAYAFTFIRRVEGAISAYREAREALIEYIGTPRTRFPHIFGRFEL